MDARGLSGLGGILGGLFGDSGSPYNDAMKQYQYWGNKAQSAQNPFLNAGNQATGNLQNWLGTMQNPSQFINNLMGHYQESPFAKYEQQQAMRAGTNAASASGLTGSSPFAQQLQQNASNISSQDMQNWLSQVLGINTQYGAGNKFLSGQGANAANAMTNMYGRMGNNMGQADYGKSATQHHDILSMVRGD